MTREEEIRHKAGSISNGMITHNIPHSECKGYYEGYIDGAEWADDNLPQDVINLNKVWHDTSEEPNENTDILFIARNGKVHKVSKVDNSLYSWLIDNKDIKRWAYIKDLLPKGGKE